VLSAGAAAVVLPFRDPDRSLGVGAVLAPADGVVIAVSLRTDGKTAVSIFMRPHDVHVNRAPVDGVVRGLSHQPGGFRPAFSKDAERNERVVWQLDSDHGDLELVQIAGALARRIIPYRRVGERIVQGERIGMIRFGSRVDLVMPPAIEPTVRRGDRVRAGVSRLGRG
jgi:phosphatidylserine decarboxylase